MYNNIYLSTFAKNSIRLKEKKINNNKTPNQIKAERVNQKFAGASLTSDVVFTNHLLVHCIVYTLISGLSNKCICLNSFCNIINLCGIYQSIGSTYCSVAMQTSILLFLYKVKTTSRHNKTCIQDGLPFKGELRCDF